MCNPVTVEFPERLLDKGVYQGYEWEITYNRYAVRCGYVRIPPGHPWHGRSYGKIDVEVHGDLTFSEPDTDCGKGGPENAWWVGFACDRACDAKDPTLPNYELYADVEAMLSLLGRTVKTTEYVRDECKSLIDQAVHAAANQKGDT